MIGCNVTKVKEANVTLMSDLKICYKIREGLAKVDIPILANSKVASWLNEPKGQEAGLEVFATYSPAWERGKGPQLSSGHYAAEFAIERLGINEVHVWGCDSLVLDHTKSYTDEIKPSPAKDDEELQIKTIKKWRKGWVDLQEKYPNAKIILHNLLSS